MVLTTQKKALINGKLYETLGAINLSDIRSLENIQGDSRCINIIFDEDILKSDHFVFSFITDSVRDMLGFFFLSC